MDMILTLVVAVGAFGLGGLIVWLLRGRDLAALKQKLAPLEAELAQLRGSSAQLEAARVQNLELEKALATANANVVHMATKEPELESARKHIIQLTAQIASLESERTSSAKAHNQQVEQLLALRQEVEEKFSVLATAALRSNNDEFVKRAEDVLNARSATIAELVKPLGESLKAYDGELKKIEQARNESYGGIKEALTAVREQHDEIRSVTAGLVNALRASPKTRGRWAEHTLQRVMELSGLVEHCDFETEKHFRSDDEAFRPDVVIQIAGDRTIIVDAKAPTSAYLDAIEATNEEEKEAHLKRHARQLRERLTNLSSKSYWEKVPGSTDCVVMFVPGDNFVSAAFERDAELFEDGIKSRVLICTPTTFIALAKAIAYGWRQEKLASNAIEVARMGKELYLRLSKMADHISLIGRHLKDSVGAYNKFVGSLENRVLPQARRFHELGVEGTSNELENLEQIDIVPQATSLGLPIFGAAMPIETET